MSGAVLSIPRWPPAFPRRRLPFLPLVLAGIAGILLGAFCPFTSLFWLLAGAFCFAGFALCKKGAALFYAGAACLFACLQLWNSRESAAAVFADWLGTRRCVAEFRGSVAAEPRVFADGRASFDLLARSVTIDGQETPLPLVFAAGWQGPVPEYGREVSLLGSLQNIPPPRNPGEFHLSAWSALRGVFSQISVSSESDARILPENHGHPLLSLALAARHWMKDTLTRGLADDALASGLITAMTLGETSALPLQVREEFRATGTFHLFSVSGLHVGMVGFILWVVLRSLAVPRRAAALAVIPALFFYVLMTGLGPAAVRSAIMASIVLAGFLTDRPPQLFNNLLAAAFLILLTDTRQLFHPGFQLSFTVVAAILLLAGPIQKFCEKWIRPDPFLPRRLLRRWETLCWDWGRKFTALAAVSLAAWLGSTPLTLGYFHLVSWSSLPANLLAVPLSFGIMAVSMLSAASGLISPVLPAIFNQSAWLLARMLVAIIQLFASLPGSSAFVGWPQLSPPLAKIVVFDFGRGAGSALSIQGREWLVDCGPERGHDSVLIPYLHSQGIGSLDGLVLTHGDAGHIGAARRLLESSRPRLIVESIADDRSPVRNRWHGLLAENNLPKRLVRAGDVLAVSPDAKLEVLYPPAGISRGTADDEALILRLTAGKASILFLSDAGLMTEQWLLRHAATRLDCDILVLGLPSDGPTISPELLEACRPSAIVAASDQDREDKLLPLKRAIRSRAIPLFRQADCGAVTIRATPDTLEAEGFIGRQTFSRPLP